MPILISSGYQQHDITEQMKRLDGARFLRKPYRVDQLRRMIRTLLD